MDQSFEHNIVIFQKFPQYHKISATYQQHL